MHIAETERLLITKVSTKDAPFFLKLMNSPKWIKYIGDRNIRNVQDASDYIKKTHLVSYKTFGFGFYKIILKNTLEPIGSCGLVQRDVFKHPDIGFSFLPEFEQRGFGYESSIEILNLAKDKFKLQKVFAITLPTNKDSIKLIEKLGLTFEKKVKPFDDDEELLLFAKNL